MKSTLDRYLQRLHEIEDEKVKLDREYTHLVKFIKTLGGEIPNRKFKSGELADMIEGTLRAAKRPMDTEEIYDALAKQLSGRVKVMHNIKVTLSTNPKRFIRDGDQFTLAEGRDEKRKSS